MWLQLALVLLIIGGGLHMLTSKRRNREREALMLRRVDAYIETIRRERKSPSLTAMSDSELRDLLHSGARNFRAAQQKRELVMLGGGAISLIAALFVSNHEGFWSFFLVAALGALVTYGLGVYLERQARAPLERHGVDIDRLDIK